jgi:hypothetical protein
MSVVLLLLGIVVAGAGLGSAGFGFAFNDLPLGPTLVLAGTTALCSGLILIGLSAVVSELRRVAESLKSRPAAMRPAQPVDLDLPAVAAQAPPTANVRPPVPAPPPPPRPRQEPQVREPRAEAPPAPAPVPVQAPNVDVSAAAIERLRSSIPRVERPDPSVIAEEEEVPLSPNGSGGHPAPVRAPAVRPSEPRVTAADRPVAAGVDTTVKPSRLDFLFRSRQARPQRQDSFDPNWPAEARAPKAEPRLEEPPAAAPTVPLSAAPQSAPAAEPSAAESQPPAILKSGVVDGMAYTLYADGSIEAKLPTGTVRFGSIAELRAHIESKA